MNKAHKNIIGRLDDLRRQLDRIEKRLAPEPKQYGDCSFQCTVYCPECRTESPCTGYTIKMSPEGKPQKASNAYTCPNCGHFFLQ